MTTTPRMLSAEEIAEIEDRMKVGRLSWADWVGLRSHIAAQAETIERLERDLAAMTERAEKAETDNAALVSSLLAGQQIAISDLLTHGQAGAAMLARVERLEKIAAAVRSAAIDGFGDTNELLEALDAEPTP